MAISDGAIERVRELFAGVSALSVRKMFGGAGVYAHGRIFAIADEQSVYLKVDEQNEPAFREAGSSPFVYGAEPDGTPLTLRYWRLPDEALDDEDALRRWTTLALGAAERASVKRSRAKSKAAPLLISGPWED